MVEFFNTIEDLSGDNSKTMMFLIFLFFMALVPWAHFNIFKIDRTVVYLPVWLYALLSYLSMKVNLCY